MEDILHVYKPVGLTPLQLISQLRRFKPELANKRLGYAGRLDPMAHGVTLVMIDQGTKQFSVYKGYDKVYDCEMVLGLSTDSYDLLGVVEEAQTTKIAQPKIDTLVTLLPGKIDQNYPPYSAVKIQGKALFHWARLGKLNSITIPSHQVNIYSACVINHGYISAQDILSYVRQTIPTIFGDFRQELILNNWEVLLGQKMKHALFQKTRLRIHCSSGTYIRSIINDLGKRLSVGAVALEIYRTSVGPYHVKSAFTLPKYD